MKKPYLIPVTYSIIIHILIILFLFNYMQSEESRPVGNQIIQTYVIHQPIIIARHKAALHQASVTKPVVPDFQHKSLFKAGIMRSADEAHAPQAGKNNKLIIMLHNQIQQYINDHNYNLVTSLGPHAITIQFLLTPQGELGNIQIIKSSGVNMLDNLAIAAVRAIQPGYVAKKYLMLATYFNIMVYFK